MSDEEAYKARVAAGNKKARDQRWKYLKEFAPKYLYWDSATEGGRFRGALGHRSAHPADPMKIEQLYDLMGGIPGKGEQVPSTYRTPNYDRTVKLWLAYTGLVRTVQVVKLRKEVNKQRRKIEALKKEITMLREIAGKP